MTQNKIIMATIEFPSLLKQDKIYPCFLRVFVIAAVFHGYYSEWDTDHSAWQKSHDLMTNDRISI